MGQRWLNSTTAQPRRRRVLEWLEEEPLLPCTTLDWTLTCIVLAVLRPAHRLHRLGPASKEDNISSCLDLRRHRD